MSKEINFDHFKNIDELLEHIDIWYKEDDIDYTRWFDLTDLYQLGKYITELRQKNKKLKQILYDIGKEYDEKSLFAEDSILTELEEWLKQEIENIKTNYSQVNGNYFNMNYKIETYEDTLEIIQKLKEKYK